MRIRPFDPQRPSDTEAVLDICLRTGDAGGDATGLYADPRALTDRYAAPYLVLEPGFAFLAERDGEVVGYIIGTPDTVAFAERFAALASEDGAADTIDRPAHTAEILGLASDDHPAHLHIDILPSGQGAGVGRRLIETLMERFREAGVPGVQLGVDIRNTGGLAFYPRVGFTRLHSDDGAAVFGRRL